MSYSSFLFFAFIIGTILLYVLFPEKSRWVILLISSWIFYTVSTLGHIVPLLLSVISIWITGILLDILEKDYKDKCSNNQSEKRIIKKRYKRIKNAVSFVGAFLCLFLLLFIKYGSFFTNFFPQSFISEIKNIHFFQPLGISFYSLQAISYIVDVNTKRIKACKNPLKLSLYLSFVFTVVEGPIIRFDEFSKQVFNDKKRITQKNIYYGVLTVLWGLIQKIVISDRIGLITNSVFDNHEQIGGITVVLGILLYTLQLYCDFNGIMCVVSGLAYLIGITLPKNFNQPFFAKTINEFWQRWHITLGQWLKDYIFYPISLSKPFLSLAKKQKKRTYCSILISQVIALFFVWFCNGFWHGVGSKYILYGLYYYFLMIISLIAKPLYEKAFVTLNINQKSKALNIFRIMRTFIIVNIGMLIFRADSIKTSLLMIKSIFILHYSIDFIKHPIASLYNGTQGTTAIYDFIIIFIGALSLFCVGLCKERNKDILKTFYNLSPFLRSFIIITLTIIIVVFGAYSEDYGINQMIYAGF